MKIVFFSSDRLEVELLGKELAEAGIPCEVRNGVAIKDLLLGVPEAELWIRNDKDSHRAFLFCVERDAGFAKREATAPTVEDLWPEIMAACGFLCRRARPGRGASCGTAGMAIAQNTVRNF